jgi:hypothetical protein
LAAFACALAVVTGTLVHRSHPAIAAGLLTAGASVIAIGYGLLLADLAIGFGGAPLSTAVVILLVAALIIPAPALLTGVALIRGPRRLA